MEVCGQASENLNEVVVSLEAGDAAGEGEKKFPFELGVFVLPLVEPGGLGVVGGVVECGIYAAVNDRQFFCGDVGVVFKDVVTDAVGDADDAFPAGHDFGVGIDGIKAVDGCNEAGSGLGVEFAPGEVGEPGGHAGAEMEDVGFFGVEQAA